MVKKACLLMPSAKIYLSRQSIAWTSGIGGKSGIHAESSDGKSGSTMRMSSLVPACMPFSKSATSSLIDLISSLTTSIDGVDFSN